MLGFRTIYNKLKTGNNPGKLLIGILILVVLVGEGRLVYKSIQIKNHGESTHGRLIYYKVGGWRGDHVVYEFEVDGVNYLNDFGVKKNSEEEIKKVFDIEFNVIYSIKDPEYNTIELGDLERIRNTIEYYDF